MESATQVSEELQPKIDMAMEALAYVRRCEQNGESFDRKESPRIRATAVFAAYLYARESGEGIKGRDYLRQSMEERGVPYAREYSDREWRFIGRVAGSSIQTRRDFSPNSVEKLDALISGDERIAINKHPKRFNALV